MTKLRQHLQQHGQNLKKIAKEDLKKLGIIGREIVSTPGDIASLFTSTDYGAKTRDVIDEYTGNRLKPSTTGEKILATMAGASGGIGLTAKLAKAAKSLPLVKQGIEGLSKGVSSLGSALAKHTPNVISKPVDLIIGKPARFIGRHSKGAFKPTVGSTAGAGVAEYFHQQDENDNVTPFLTGAGAGIGMSE